MQKGWMAVLFGSLVIWLVGCGLVGSQQENETVAALPLKGGALVATLPAPAPSPLPAPAVQVIEAAGNHPAPVPPPAALALPDRDQLATATPVPTATPTATPLPTFTPPALPGTSPDEHYWLRRPVPEGGVVWTDKIYPYGSTRGGTLRPHSGVEFMVPAGTPVLAAASGVVIVAGDDRSEQYGEFNDFYGLLVVIEHDVLYNGRPLFTLYGHLSELFVVPGQRVEALAPIGRVGGTGVADGPHLHFEVRVGSNDYGSTRNPVLWIYPFKDHGTIAGRVQLADGRLLAEVPVSVARIDAPSGYRGTTSYAVGPQNADDLWQENFALDDIPAGYYLVTAMVDGRRFSAETWVYPYRTSLVEIVVRHVPPTAAPELTPEEPAADPAVEETE
jgi:murein DD-endopeptidase MepM/ murein hydrolase activator NlpD